MASIIQSSITTYSKAVPVSFIKYDLASLIVKNYANFSHLLDKDLKASIHKLIKTVATYE
jgi:hypothetical protein